MTSLPTMNEIICWYLYGQKTRPENMLDNSIIGREAASV